LRWPVVVPDGGPATKLAAIERLGAQVVAVPHDEWFDTFRTRRREGIAGLLVHAFSDDAVMAGNGTIGLEILEDLPEVDAVVVPFGGGGLACGIASALRVLRPQAKVFAAEVATAAPLAASLAAGRATSIEHVRTFVDGIGGPRVFPEMFALARELLDGSLVSSLAEVAGAVRMLVERHHVVAEGAGVAGRPRTSWTAARIARATGASAGVAVGSTSMSSRTDHPIAASAAPSAATVDSNSRRTSALDSSAMKRRSKTATQRSGTIGVCSTPIG